MEKLKRLKQQQEKAKAVDNTSEDECTYSKVEQTANVQISKVAASESMMQDICRLVQESEELVTTDENKKENCNNCTVEQNCVT